MFPVKSFRLNADLAVSMLSGADAKAIDENAGPKIVGLASEHDSSASSEPDSSLSMSSTDLSSPLHQMITEMREIVTCILRQTPSLRDPSSQDTRTQASYEGADSFDQSHVRSKFPNANPELLNRLGTANWKRRQQLLVLREANKDDALASDRNDGENSPNEKQEMDCNSEADVSMYSTSYGTGLKSQMTGGWTSSDKESKIGTGLTSLTDNPGQKLQNFNRPVVAAQVHRLKLPRPPEPNSSFEGRQFKCPYCFHGLVEVDSSSSWK